MLTLSDDLTDAEIDVICAGLKQSAAKVRYLQGLGLHVERKPNGRPLVNRAHYVQVRSTAGARQDGNHGSEPAWGVH